MCATLLVALGLIRWLAPHLLGIRTPVDLEVVQMDRRVVPFYDGVFNGLDPDREGWMINDPLVGHRRPSLFLEHSRSTGPSDLLGFRNRAVPVAADIVAIGDSQTLGVNATMDTTWPSLLAAMLPAKHPSVYNISQGGWGAVQYLYMFDKALAFRPRVVVVAFYTGNDPTETVRLAYAFEPWAFLKGEGGKPAHAPSAWPPREADTWKVQFADGVATALNAASRLTSNDRDYPATGEGYRLMGEVARRMDEAAGRAGVALVLTVIPTKELALAAKVGREGLTAPDDYRKLVADERANVRELATTLRALPHATYVDTVAALQGAALGDRPLYQEDVNGHPVARGYAVIARALAPAVDRALPPPPAEGLALLARPDGEKFTLVLIRDGVLYRFADPRLAVANGWDPDWDALPRLDLRDVAVLASGGALMEVDPAHFGPRPGAG